MGKNCGGACLFLISNTYLSVPERNSDHILGHNSEKKMKKKKKMADPFETSLSNWKRVLNPILQEYSS